MIIVKTPEQIENIRSACQIVAGALREVETRIGPGVSTGELDKFVEGYIRDNGGEPAFIGYRGYKYATCTSLNHEVVHGLPGRAVLKAGDILGLDIGAKVNGYYGDAARTFAVGEIPKKTRKLLKSTEEALAAGITQARDGNHLGDISAAIEKVAERHGFSVVRDLYGHGVGIELHEDPLIPNFGEPGHGPLLKENMVLAIEPMLNVGGSNIRMLADKWTIITEDRSLSAHFEHTILVRKGEAEILTWLQKM
ncbi:MAG: type I methionyl aminopeptidase [Candidatus Margulisiibacteriota bacterium]|nr:type I methionyl aminopeptidase [Candidatus Margulisiibacteriota bacterium]